MNKQSHKKTVQLLLLFPFLKICKICKCRLLCLKHIHHITAEQCATYIMISVTMQPLQGIPLPPQVFGDIRDWDEIEDVAGTVDQKKMTLERLPRPRNWIYNLKPKFEKRGDRRRETRDVRQKIWNRRQETWDRRRETEGVRQETCDRRCETGDTK